MTLFIILWVLSGIVSACITRKVESQPMPVLLYLLCIFTGPMILIGQLLGQLLDLMAEWKI